MSALSSNDLLLIEKLEAHLKAEGYSYQVRQRYPACARQFLQYCQRNALEIETARPLHIARFMRRHYRLFRKRRGEASPPSPSHKWCHQYTGAINMLLRLVHGRWPLPASPSTAIEAFHCEIVHDYDVWLRDLRGLAPVTRTKRTIRALQFLSWLGPQADKDGLGKLSVSDLDMYLQQRCAGSKRASVEDYVVCLRDFLRHLKRSGYVAGDLSEVIIGPRIYDHEGIPSALRAEEVTQVLEAAREDRSPGGLRDYAILILLAVYGLRAGEVVRLRLDDIVWRQDVLRVRHAKTGTYSELPLLTEPGEALLRYLKEGRPRSAHREIFLRIQAPHRPFKNGSILTGVTRARLRSAGLVPQGRQGSHAFRHARAVSLLRSGVPLKIIGDLLGHRSPSATADYLKLATEDLRSVGLDLPRGVTP